MGVDSDAEFGGVTLVATAENKVEGRSQVTFAAQAFGSLTFTQPVPNGTADNTPLTLTVKLVDSSELPIGGATINWGTVEGKATAAGNTSATNQDGIATMDYSSGSAGTNTISAAYNNHNATQHLLFL